jgi:hypothetical protein
MSDISCVLVFIFKKPLKKSYCFVCKHTFIFLVFYSFFFKINLENINMLRSRAPPAPGPLQQEEKNNNSNSNSSNDNNINDNFFLEFLCCPCLCLAGFFYPLLNNGRALTWDYPSLEHPFRK